MAWRTELKSHRQRVKGMRPQTDSTNQHGQKMHEVLTVNRQYGKGAELRRLRSEEINTENTVLLDKITRIRTANTFEFFR